MEDFNPAASTAELADIDELVLYINDSLPIPEAAKFRIYGVFFLACSPVPPIHPNRSWLERENAALSRIKPELLLRFREVERQLAPDR